MTSKFVVPPELIGEGCIYSRILRKMERSLRNNTGCRLSHEEMVAILRSPAWMLIVEKEREELIEMVEARESADDSD